MKKLVLILTLLSSIYLGYGQTAYMFFEKGQAQFNNNYFQVDYSLNSGDATNIRGMRINDLSVGVYQPDAIIGNTLQVFSGPTITADNGVIVESTSVVTDFSISSLPICKFTLNVPSTHYYNYVNIHVTYEISTLLNIDNALRQSIRFPFIAGDVPQSEKVYVNKSVNIQSDDSRIISEAQTVTNGHTNLIDVIDDLTKWIQSNITFKNDALARDAVSAYTTKVTQCEGGADLLAAFCRSLGIPARVCSGYFIIKSFPVSYPSGFTPSSSDWSPSGTEGEGEAHAACEIYFPTLGWLRCDPAQRTVDFGKPHFVKLGHSTEISKIVSLSAIGWKPEYLNSSDPSSYEWSSQPKSYREESSSMNIGSLTNTITALDFCAFSGIGGLYSIYRKALDVGIHDVVKIQDPPAASPYPKNTLTFPAGSKASFYAKFTTGTVPPTSANNYDWKITLYHSTGTYTYIQQNATADIGGATLWCPTTPSTLPAYNWLKDPNGNIYGEVSVLVHISDGDTKTDVVKVGVSAPACTPSISNTTYTTNTTINGCSNLTLQNVTIQNNSSVVIKATDNTTINGTFNIQLGSTFQVTK